MPHQPTEREATNHFSLEMPLWTDWSIEALGDEPENAVPVRPCKYLRPVTGQWCVISVEGHELQARCQHIYTQENNKTASLNATELHRLAVLWKEKYQRFTDSARRAMFLATQASIQLDHEYVGAEHLFLGLLREESGVVNDLLIGVGADPDRLRSELETIVKPGPDVVLGPLHPLTPSAGKAIECSIHEANRQGHDRAGPEHLLMGLLGVPECLPAVLLARQGSSRESVWSRLSARRLRR